MIVNRLHIIVVVGRCCFVVDMSSWATLVWKRRQGKQLMMKDGYIQETSVVWIR